MHFRGDTALQFGAFARYSDSRHTGLIAIQHSSLSSVLTDLYYLGYKNNKKNKNNNNKVLRITYLLKV